MFDTPAVSVPHIRPERGPNTRPVAIIRKVHGWMFGRGAKGILATEIMAAIIPTRATSFDEMLADSYSTMNMPMRNTRKTKLRAGAYLGSSPCPKTAR